MNQINNNKMKTTKIMIAGVATFLLTFLLAGLVAYLLSDSSYRDCLTNPAMFFFMVVFGFIPSIVVCNDLDNLLNK